MTVATVGRRTFKAIEIVLLAGVVVYMIVPSVLVVVLSFSDDPFIKFPPDNWGGRQWTLCGCPRRRIAASPARASASAVWSWCWSGLSATVPPSWWLTVKAASQGNYMSPQTCAGESSR